MLVTLILLKYKPASNPEIYNPYCKIVTTTEIQSFSEVIEEVQTKTHSL